MLRVHLVTAATSFLAWLPLVAFDANVPFDWPYFAASPVLRELLGLSALVGLGAAAATAAASMAVLALLSAAKRPLPGGVAAAIPVVHTAVVVAACPAVNRLAIAIPVGEVVGLCALFVGAAVIVAVAALALGPPLDGAVRASLPATATVAAVVALGWAATVASGLALRLGDPRAPILAFAALGLAVQQVRVARRVDGGRSGRAAALVVLGASVAAPLVVTCLSALPVGPPAAASARAAPDAPNVVVVMIDTLRADHTSLGSGDPDVTPNLLALSRERSTYFSRAIAAGSSTAPSVKAFFTSRSPSHWGLEATNAAPPADAWRFVQSFAAAGYQTAGISANPLVERKPYSGGFDYFWSAGGYRFWQRSFLLNVLWSGKRLWQVFRRVERLRLDKIDASTVRRLASDWLDRRRKDVPFLLYLHFMDPHWPYYDHGYFEPTPSAEHGFSYVDYLGLDHGNPSLSALRDGRNVRHLRHLYGEEVRHIDAELGLLFEDLERRDLLDDTILVVLGDHGEEFLEHDGFSHGHDVYEEQVHVPLLIHWPRGDAYASMPERIDGPVSLLDLAPTFVELLGLPEAPSDLDGRSLAARLASRDRSEAPPVTSESSLLGRSRMAYREGDLKARVEYRKDVPPWESDELQVVDLAEDPGEHGALDRDDEDVAGFVARARRFLREHRRQGR